MSTWLALIQNDRDLVTEISSKDALKPLKEILQCVVRSDFIAECGNIRDSLSGPSKFYFTKYRKQITEDLSRPASWGKVEKFQGLLPLSLKHIGRTIETVANNLAEQKIPKLGVLDLSYGDLVPEDLPAVSELADLVEHVVVLDLSCNSFTSNEEALVGGLSLVAEKWADKVDFILLYGNSIWIEKLGPPFIFRLRANMDLLIPESRDHHIRYFRAINPQD